MGLDKDSHMGVNSHSYFYCIDNMKCKQYQSLGLEQDYFWVSECPNGGLKKENISKTISY